MREGVTFRSKILGNPEKTAKIIRRTSGIADKLNQRSRLHRKFLELLVGIHRDKNLPSYPKKTFSSWAESKNLICNPSEGEVVIFPTCYVENNEPQIGQDTVTVLQKNEVSVTCEKGLECCGMPAWEWGARRVSGGEGERERESGREGMDGRGRERGREGRVRNDGGKDGE